MARLMSFALTERQLLDGSKTVTRRIGWEWLTQAVRSGPVPLVGVRKSMGLRPGEKVVRLRAIQVVRAHRQCLRSISDEEAALEGFPHLTGAQFVEMFCEHVRATPDSVVTRIEFVPGQILLPASMRQIQLFPGECAQHKEGR